MQTVEQSPTEVTQGSEAWFALRAGHITSSRAKDLMSKGRGGAPSVGRAKLITTLASERLTGKCEEGFSNDAMKRGTELEPEAIAAYEFATDQAVERVGFLEHPTIKCTGSSPDGLIGSDGQLEIKCPASQVIHIEALRLGAHAKQYRWQLQHQLFVSGREWVEIVSYDPRLPLGLQLAIRRVFKNTEDHEALAAEIAAADAEVTALVAELEALAGAVS